MSWKSRFGNAGRRARVGGRAIGLPGVRSLTDADRPSPAPASVGPLERRPAIDRSAVQHLDRVRAIYRPTRRETLAPGLERFIGREDTFRRVGEVDTASGGREPMMQCPSHWPDGVRWVPIGDLEVLEILDDQDIRAG